MVTLTRTRTILSTLLAISILVLFTSCTPRPRTYGRSMMGTEVMITIHDGPFSPTGKAWVSAADSAFTEMERVDGMCWSGELATFNDSAATGVPCPLSPELAGLIDHAFEISDATGNAFSPTLGPLIDAWGIAYGEPRIPRPGEIDTLLIRTQMTVLTKTNDGEFWLRPRRSAINLGGIAKGYAVDRAVEVLQQQGITAGMVWAGGDLRVFGEKPDHTPWRIAVRHPRGGEEYLAVLELDEPMAVATSGDYERYFEVDGVRYHHILDPQTGYPARASISATAVANTCMDADALATALFVMGPEWGTLYAEEIGLPSFVVAQSNTGLVVSRSEDMAPLISVDGE